MAVLVVRGWLSHSQHGEQLVAPLLSTQVLILSPAFLKYIHDNWTQHHGRYPSTGFTALLFALHACQQVSVARCCHRTTAALLVHAFSGRPSNCTAMALAGVCTGLRVWLWRRQ